MDTEFDFSRFVKFLDEEKQQEEKKVQRQEVSATRQRIMRNRDPRYADFIRRSQNVK
jgi:hypothetical protein